MKNGIAILVVLAPAIATALVGFMVALLPAILTKLHSMMHSASDVEWFKELVMHSAFYGSVVAAVLGFKKEAHETAYLAAAWFVVLLYLSRLLSNRLKELEENESSDVHRKNAGMTRSVIRGELVKSAQHRKETWID